MSDNTTTDRLNMRLTGEYTSRLGLIAADTQRRRQPVRQSRGGSNDSTADCRAKADPSRHGRQGPAVIETRKFMQERTVLAIMAAAATFGAAACPVFRKGRVDEVHLFRGGQLRASIFSPAEGRIGIWRVDGSEAVANTPFQAVQRVLDPLRKNTHARLAA
jgi:hypothetical protein